MNEADSRDGRAKVSDGKSNEPIRDREEGINVKDDEVL